MKKKYDLEDLDCAVCAQKMEDAAKKVPGVIDCGVNFLLQKITVTAADEEFEEVMDRVVAACKKVKPKVKIVR